MMTLLFEQPWMIGAIGAIVTGLTIYGWVQTGNPAALKAAAGIFVVAMVLLLLNILIDTDREIVQRMLYATAKDLENNDETAILARIHPVHTDRVDEGIELIHTDRMEQEKTGSRRVTFHTVQITSIHEILVESNRPNPRATIRMNVVVDADRVGFRRKVPRFVRLTLNKSKEAWLITDVEHRDPQHEFMNQPSIPLQQLDGRP